MIREKNSLPRIAFRSISINGSVALVCLFSFFLVCSTELRWPWNTVSITNISFPRSFFWGTAASALQSEGAIVDNGTITEDSWLAYERNHNVAMNDRVEDAAGFWELYPEDIQRMADLHLNLYRFSISWSKIEPEPGKFNEAALAHYEEMIDVLIKKNITPMITLFHHSYPTWIDEKGGFEKFSNFHYFFKFAEHVFKRFHKKVHYWITFNEPIAFAFEAFFRGSYPPNKTGFKLAGIVARNMLFSHVEVAHHFKSIDPTVEIGIAHMINPLDPYHSWNPLEQSIAKFFDYILNKLLINFFKTGKFNWAFIVRDQLDNAPQSLDFIGVNYYTHTLVCQRGIFKIGTANRPDEKIITAPQGQPDSREHYPSKVLYPEGLYRAIELSAMLNKPIFITENGGPAADEELIKEFMKKHLYVVWKALADGYDVRGYLYWSLTDCFCWKRGYRNKHGIYAVDFKTKERTYRPAFDYFLSIVAQSTSPKTNQAS